MTPSLALFYFCISFIVGIAVESFAKFPAIFLWGFLVAALICITAYFFKKEAALIGFCMLFFILGVTRFQIADFAIASDTLSLFNDRPEKITLTGKIISEPDVRLASQKLRVAIHNTKSIVLVSTDRHSKYHYLDNIKITGKLKTPVMFEGFNYKSYLAKDGIYSVMDFPDIELMQGPREYTIMSFSYEKVLLVKNKLIESISRHFSSPGNIILQGVIFGNDKNMPVELKNQFNITGLSHITAVSGTNIIILINVLMVILLASGLWRGQAFYFSLALIWFYLIMIGLPVSGVRAGIMGSVGLFAQKFGRQNTSARVLVITASAMLLQNPMLLASDVSFQLSFLASLGIVYLKPIIDYCFTIISWEGAQWLLQILSVTLSAQIVTLPIIVYNFGRISLIAPITNVLALPAVELLTVLGFLTSIAGSFFGILGFIISLPCLALVWYLIKVLDIFSTHFASATIEHISWLWAVAYYSLLLGLVVFFKKLQRPKFLG